jgi:hypothetical protein
MASVVRVGRAGLLLAARNSDNEDDDEDEDDRGRRRTVVTKALPADPFAYSNSDEYAAIDDAVVELFYTESGEEVIFDPDNDTALLELFAAPFRFVNSASLQLYEALTDRARYSCKPHPAPRAVVERVVGELAVPVDNVLVFVYKRDSARASLVRNRRRAPFRNSVNGLESPDQRSPPLLLFAQYSYEPRLLASLIWHDAPRANSTVGLLAFELIEIV